jgi:hypothetical protein
MAEQSIIWNYINKKSIAIEAIKDYKNMQKIVDSTPEKIKSLSVLKSPKIDGMPRRQLHQQTADAQIIYYIGTADVLRKKYARAIEFLEWFTPAWISLSNQEQYILDEFYAVGNNTGAAKRLSYALNYSEPHVYRIKDDALNKFAFLLLVKHC